MTLPLVVTLFVAGLLTILLPCILPLIPIVLGVSIAGRSKLRPLYTISGMLVSFVGFTFLLSIVLNQFVGLTDYIRISTYYILVLFGLGFAAHGRWIQNIGAVLGSLFFLEQGWIAVAVAAVLGVIAMEVGGKVATRIQQLGTDVQKQTREGLGEESWLSAFIIGLTMGFVWVPCAGPSLGFAITLVHEQPGVQAFLLLAAYGLGTAIPLLIIGYGGQSAVHSVRFMSRYSGHIKRISGWLLILTAISFQLQWFARLESWFVQNTDFGTFGINLEQKLVGDDLGTELLNNDTK